MRNINQALKRKNARFKNAPTMQQTDAKTIITQKQKTLREYKDQLETLNQRANQMFEHMKQINKLVSKKVMDIEDKVTKSEGIFVDEINKLLKNKREIDSYQQKSQYITRENAQSGYEAMGSARRQNFGGGMLSAHN